MTVSDERVVELLEELVAWTKLGARGQLIDLLKSVLAEPHHLRAFELTDGTKTQKEIGALSGLSQSAISILWQKWRRLGICSLKNGKTVHLVRPSEWGFEIPNAPKTDEPRRNSAVEIGVANDE